MAHSCAVTGIAHVPAQGTPRTSQANEQAMKLEWEKPQVNADGNAIEYRAKMTMEVREIRAHPTRFLSGVGDTYQGTRIVRDASIPYNEIHVIEGNRRMIMRYKDST